jgi:hypothetical protein
MTDPYMADQPGTPETGDVTGGGPDREATVGIPRWVKVFGIIGIVVVLLVVLMLLTGHGPGRHMSGGLGEHTLPASILARGVQPT